MLDLLKDMYRPVLKDGGLVAASIGYAIFSGLLPLLSVLIVHILVGLLTEANVEASRLIMVAGLYAALFILCTSVSSQLKGRNSTKFMLLRLKALNKMLDKHMTMDYGLYENPSFLDDLGNWSRSLASNNTGLEGSYHKIFELGGTFISLILLGGLLFMVSPLIALVAIVFVIVFTWPKEILPATSIGAGKSFKGLAGGRASLLERLRTFAMERICGYLGWRTDSKGHLSPFS